MENIRIIATAEGSHTLINTDLNETYHSRHGARAESLHVFIGNGLDHYLKLHAPREMRVLEVGFGSGLNAFLALQRSALSSTRVHYAAIEPFPLPEPIWSVLNYAAGSGMEDDFRLLHELPWGVDHALRTNFIFRKEQSRIQDHCRRPVQADVVFYDAFAPDRQPEMWSPETLSPVCGCLSTGGVLVTYCAQGQLKRTLKALGMTVEALPGAPGKKEMTRATKIQGP